MEQLITKYGLNIPNITLMSYFKGLIGKIYKFLPLREENCNTLDLYYTYIMKELNGGNKLILDDKLFIELLLNLEGVIDIEDFKTYRSQILKCISVCQKIINDLQADDKVGDRVGL
jgi:hypothetical protein